MHHHHHHHHHHAEGQYAIQHHHHAANVPLNVWNWLRSKAGLVVFLTAATGLWWVTFNTHTRPVVNSGVHACSWAEQNSLIAEWKLSPGLAVIWTRIAGFRVLSANHYTTRPLHVCTHRDFSIKLTRRSGRFSCKLLSWLMFSSLPQHIASIKILIWRIAHTFLMF